MLYNREKFNSFSLLISYVIWLIISIIIITFIFTNIKTHNNEIINFVNLDQFFVNIGFLATNINLLFISDIIVNMIDILTSSGFALLVFLLVFLSGVSIITGIYFYKTQARIRSGKEQVNFFKLKERHLNKRLIQEKQMKEIQVNKVLDYSTDCYVKLSDEYKVVHLNSSAKEFFNKVSSVSQYHNIYVTDLIPDIKSTNFVQTFSSVMNTQVSKTAEIYLQRQKRWIQARMYYENNYISMYFNDITSKKESDIGIGTGISLLKQLLDTSLDPISLVDLNWKYKLYNQKWNRSFGLEEKDTSGKSILENIPSFNNHLSQFQGALTRGENIKMPEFKTMILGKEEWIKFDVKPYRDEDDKVSGFIISSGFTTQVRKRRKQAEKQRETERRLAYHDMLTGLPNRQLFNDRLSESLTNAYRNLKKTALLFIDLDGFKSVNDTLGHDVGDRLLQDVSQRLLDATRSSDTVARLGGDEFTIILNNIEAVEDVATIAKKLITSIAVPYDYGDGIVAKVTGSIGISMYPKDGSSTVDLIKHADEAMYKAKNSGKNSYVFYESKQIDINSEVITSKDVQNAINQNEFILHYQGHFDTEKEKVYGVEGLLRWKHPQYGLLRAGQFLSIIEQDDIMVDLGHYILRRSCQQLKNWEKEGQQGLLLSINISPREFNDKGFIKNIEKIINEYDIKPNSLGLEISEAIMLQNSTTVSKTLKALKALGIVLIVENLDKEGMSMNIIKDANIDMLKISSKYIQDIGVNEDSENAIISFIKMANSLSIEPAADCVETQEQADFLNKHGCYKVQGFLYGRPTKPTKHFDSQSK